MGYKKDKNIQSLDHLEVPKTLEKFIKELPDRYDNGEINREVEEQIDAEWNEFRKSMKKNRGLVKKVVAITLSIAVAFSLFIGSAFVSPAMAQIVSSIPYLNGLFESKPLFEEINEALEKNKYKYSQLGVSIREKKVMVGFDGPLEHYQQVKSPVEELIKEILKARNNDAYTVNVFYDKIAGKKYDEQTNDEQSKEFEKITGIVGEVLQEFGYDTNGIGVRPGKIHIDYIPNTEKRVDDIKSRILKRLQQEQFNDYKIKFYLYDPKLQEREGRLLPLYHTITEGLTAKTEYKVDGTGYSNKKERFYIVVRTALSSTDSDRDEVVENIEKTIQDFLQSKEALEAIQDDIYEVVILSKDQEKLKTIKN
ncbi:DUF4030 domain-containing protein [Ferdinandcohnia quinoae]|uniref:DUF4030 domain-containing protein n=1 Tax=Fredinandcohnia quinoae TaxID=2918902 RepID=A0AAW5E6N4_9BACI|nr:DUF4030 domain-containing protein [Fredinandcohnia sp. SECRCQ15]MCH1626900.1 DUF4030 domain-containing protein [Fredinandcohnia sp. SECRCQ15]